MRVALLRLLKEEYDIVPTANETKAGDVALEAASPFEAVQTDQPWTIIDQQAARDWLIKIGDIAEKSSSKSQIQNALRTRGLLWLDREEMEYFALAAGILFLGKDPSVAFPQCRILADAYRGSEPDPNPSDQLTISAPAPKTVQRVVDFVNKKRATRPGLSA